MKNKTVREKIADKIYWPCYKWVRDHVSPIWYRFFGYRFHIVKTKLTPSVWYDSDIRILYAVMAIVEWFVENDMAKISEKDFKEELERIEKEVDDPEIKEYERTSWTNQYEFDCKIIQIYDWWKNYPNREKEIRKALNDWGRVALGDDIFPRSKGRMTREEFEEESKLSDHLHELEDKLEKEEQEMLKLAVDIRNRMWS